MLERPNRLVSKTMRPQGHGGSNPSPAASIIIKTKTAILRSMTTTTGSKSFTLLSRYKRRLASNDIFVTLTQCQ